MLPGNINPPTVSAISGVLSDIAASVPAFKLRLEGIGAYPDRSSPKVIWAGVKEGMDSCEKLAVALKGPLKDLGIALEDRKFSAHVTLGRVRGTDKLDGLRRAVDSSTFSGLSQSNIDRVILFESRLGPAGPSYTPLFKARLAPHAL
jgi:2'-5' RNA ligase